MFKVIYPSDFKKPTETFATFEEALLAAVKGMFSVFTNFVIEVTQFAKDESPTHCVVYVSGGDHVTCILPTKGSPV